jgi:hypothetical protein
MTFNKRNPLFLKRRPSPDGVPVRSGRVGSAVILSIVKDGRMISLEVKKPSTKHETSQAQEEFLAEVEKRGGITVH